MPTTDCSASMSVASMCGQGAIWGMIPEDGPPMHAQAGVWRYMNELPEDEQRQEQRGLTREDKVIYWSVAITLLILTPLVLYIAFRARTGL